MYICSTYCLLFCLEKSGYFPVWRVVTLNKFCQINQWHGPTVHFLVLSRCSLHKKLKPFCLWLQAVLWLSENSSTKHGLFYLHTTLSVFCAASVSVLLSAVFFNLFVATEPFEHLDCSHNTMLMLQEWCSIPNGQKHHFSVGLFSYAWK